MTVNQTSINNKNQFTQGGYGYDVSGNGVAAMLTLNLAADQLKLESSPLISATLRTGDGGVAVLT
jgi:hypothetical protein